MLPPFSYRKSAHNSKKSTDSTPVKKTPASVTPITKPRDEETKKSLTTRIKMLEKRVLELKDVFEVTTNANNFLKPEVNNLQQYTSCAYIIVGERAGR